ncbi:MAG TPA: aminotransferase class IV [Flavitalea sp.]|nr:aminotransferase class IV [Flavitalea sp.]
MTNRFAFINGDIIQEKKATLHISDLAIQRGYGVFDYCRTNDHVPIHLEDHIDRFLRSADIMQLQSPVSRESLVEIIHELIRKNEIPQSGIRMLLTGGYSPDSYEIIQPNLIILQHPLVLLARGAFDKGIKIITHEYVREFPHAKTINYSMGIWLQRKIKEQGAADVLYHQQGEVSEFPRANFFIVTKGDVIVTPKRNVLYGITRKKILELSPKGVSIEEGVVTLADIRAAKEAFMTSTTKRVLPIVQVDNIMIGDGRCGEVTNLIDQLLVKEENVIVQ